MLRQSLSVDMVDKLWKQTEREIARLLNGERVPITGRQRGDAPDVAHHSLSIEVKSGKKIPAYNWYADAIDQAREAIQSDKSGTVPIVIAHAKGKQHKDDLVVMSLGDFIEGFLDEDKQVKKLKTIWRGLDSEEDGIREAEAEEILSRIKSGKL